jgi:hypothetical protein
MDGVNPDAIAGRRALHRDCFREQAHASFRGAVADQPCRSAEASDRRHDNNGAAAGADSEMFGHARTGRERCHWHGYFGIEAATVERIAEWIATTNSR